MKQEAAILLAFIKDKLALLILYITNTALITLFFNLSLKSTEWLYPILISSVIFIPYLIVEWFSYRKLILMLDFSETNMPDEIYTNTQYIKKVNSSIIKIHRRYNNKLNEEMQKNIEFRRVISQFVHAMKTPVTVIELALQRCKDSIDEEEGECAVIDTINDISEENTRQLEMLNNLLEYLRLEEFSKDYTPVEVDLYSELTQVINSKKKSFIYNNVCPNIIIDKMSEEKDKVNYKVEILTDVKWNRIMLDQIISNAIKYSATTEKMKTIDFTISQFQDKTILNISDYGMGIPQQDIPKIMEPFFTGENGRKMKNSTGIGLYIVKLISENLSHEILIESQVGVGTQVKIIYHKNQNNRLI